MFYLVSACFALVPMLIYVLIIWKTDKYDREPLSLVLLNYLWGAFGAVILTFLLGALLNKLISATVFNNSNLFDIKLSSPIIEECTKGVFLLFFSSNRKFNNMTDGMVYGGAIGLGFGTTENFLYFITYGTNLHDLVFLIIVRTFFSAVMHCIATGIFGAFVGYSRFRKGFLNFILLPAGLLLAITIHITWNLCVSYDNTAISGFISMIITITVFIFVFVMSVYNDKKIIYFELADEVANGTIPAEHMIILNSRGCKIEGLADKNRSKTYRNAMVTLAFRKMQFKYASGTEKYLCEKDIEFNKQLIHDILTKNSFPDE